MSGQPLEGSTTPVCATSPRLFGVPVPLRAFGFAPGWRHEPIVGAIVHTDPTIDLRHDGSIDGMPIASWRSLGNVSPLAAKRTGEATQAPFRAVRYRPRTDMTPADTTSADRTNESEVAAA